MESINQYLQIAVEGCCHGELDTIYETIQQSNQQVDLLLICGDFQCVRDIYDLQCVAVPEKYKQLNTFADYVQGKKVAPIMTIFIGGNHEASNILQSLYYGGFVAPNIYYLGAGGCIWFGGIRIAGLSGIFDQRDYYKGHFESPPYNNDTLRSVYHLREIEVYRISNLHHYMDQTPIDVFLSHDWPQHIWEYGNKQQLLKIKPYFTVDIEAKKLGSPPLWDVLTFLKPSFWFAAHLHVKFAAVVPHHFIDLNTIETKEENLAEDQDTSNKADLIFSGLVSGKCTRFLALDKVIPRRDFLQLIKIPKQKLQSNNLYYDLEWLSILKLTNSLMSNSKNRSNIPSTNLSANDIKDTIMNIKEKFEANGNENFMIQNISPQPKLKRNQGLFEGNIQTDQLLELLELQHLWTVKCDMIAETTTKDANEISID